MRHHGCTSAQYHGYRNGGLPWQTFHTVKPPISARIRKGSYNT
jgi:hypothetical protein